MIKWYHPLCFVAIYLEVMMSNMEFLLSEVCRWFVLPNHLNEFKGGFERIRTSKIHETCRGPRCFSSCQIWHPSKHNHRHARGYGCLQAEIANILNLIQYHEASAAKAEESSNRSMLVNTSDCIGCMWKVPIFPLRVVWLWSLLTITTAALSSSTVETPNSLKRNSR